MLYTIGLYLIIALGNIAGNIFFKLGADKMPVIGTAPFGQVAKALLNGWFFLGLLGFALSFPALVLLLTRQKISLAYPIVTGLTFTAVVLISALFLRESLTAVQIAGILVVFIGLVMLA